MSPSRLPSRHVDICIIGAGIAGALLGYKLASDGYSVVILEAGPGVSPDKRLERLEKALRPEHDLFDIWDEGIDADRDKYTAESPDNIDVQLNENRLKIVGGTTQHWAAHVPRMHEKDFNMETEYGVSSDWPINYQDLMPYYSAAEYEIGVAGGGDNPFIPRNQDPPLDAHPPSPSDRFYAKACTNLGITTHSNPLAINSEAYDGRSQCVGYSTCSPVCPSGARYSGDVHIAKAVDAGARVIDQVPVLQLEHDPNGSDIVAAVYTTPDGKIHRQQASHFVLTCGGIEIPRLLLLSSSKTHPDGLANTSGLVGKHLHFECSVEIMATHPSVGNETPIGFPTMVSEQYYTYTDSQPGSFRIRFRNQDPQWLINQALSQRNPISQPFIGSKWGDDLTTSFQEPSSNDLLRIDAQIEMLPRKGNSVSLNHNVLDSFGNPVPHLTLDIGSHEIETGHYALDTIKLILQEMDANIQSVSDPKDQSFRFHHKGTTRMGADQETSVVRPTMQTHDHDNLWIVSSSVFPTGGAVNPTLTIAALALHATDNIKNIV